MSFNSILSVLHSVILYVHMEGAMGMDYVTWFPGRVAALRTQKGVSARDMSLSLGQSESYINKIENGRTLPSMTGFLYICEYLGVTPSQFFDAAARSPVRSKALEDELEKLLPEQAEHILQVVRDLIRR